MDPLIARHLPLITNRISFVFNPPPSLPPLTNRKEFLDTRDTSTTPTRPNHSVLRNQASSLKCSASVQFGFEVEKMTDEGDGEEDEEVDDIFQSAILIPKPSGEPGRPHSGGYSLDGVLSPWGVAMLAKVTVHLFPSQHDSSTLSHHLLDLH